MTLDQDYDAILKTQLELRLKRPALSSELTNADNDSDLVTETLWQLVVSLEKRIAALEKTNVII